VLRWARHGELPAIYLSNRAIRFREDQLETWLAERATPTRNAKNHAERRPVGLSSLSPMTADAEGSDAC
jgi:hypothetical protein